MAELAWLDGYAGQTVDELLALERTHRIDSLVLAFEQAIGQKAAREGDDNLTTEEKTVLAVEALEREVNNGGFDQFFVNTMEFAPVIVQALRGIGCPRLAGIAEEAITALRLPVDDDVRTKALGECDRRYFEYPECIEERLFAFIKANTSKIRF